jgi:hypothetical protein
MVLDRDDPKRGEITILAEAHEAARLAEDLIESGVEVERIRIFDATELEMKVVHKPIVSLGKDEGENGLAHFADEPLMDHEEPEPVAVRSGGSDDEQYGDDQQLLSEEPLMRNGVRFSSLFKSDDVG